MVALFLVTLIASLVTLVVGLIKPSIFQSVIRRTLGRKAIGLIFGGCALASFILIGVFAPPVEKTAETAAEQTPIQNNEPEQVTAPEAPQAQDVVVVEGSQNEAQTATAPVQSPPAPKLEVVQPAAPRPQLYAVVSVVDGDTFKVSIDGKTETLRMIGMDTPETVDPRKPVQCFGVEASNKAKALLTGKKVRLEADATQGERDKYSRLLRYAYLEDGAFFNKLMISEGYAHEYTYNTPYKYQAQFKQAETEARNAKRGLWADDACPATSQSTSTTTTSTPPATGHTYYTSSDSRSTYYYCDTDDGWKGLSAKNLKSFSSAEALLQAYPSRKLHAPC